MGAIVNELWTVGNELNFYVSISIINHDID